MVYGRRFFHIFIILFAIFATSSAFALTGITYQGRILKPNGQPLEGMTVQFRLQIRSPIATDCLMYEEVQTINMTGSKGLFSVTMADGNGVRMDTPLYGIDQIFANRGTFALPNPLCNSGASTYTPSLTDNRVLQVKFQDETMGVEEAMPPQAINFVPFAIEAKQVAGFPASSLLRFAESNGTLVNTSPLNNAQYTELLALLAGTSSQFEQAGNLNGTVLPTLVNGQVLGWAGGNWSAVDPISGVQAFAKTALPVCGVNEFLKDNGSGLLTCVVAANSGGTVTQVNTGTGLTGGGFTTTGTISIAAGGVGTTELANNAVTTGKILDGTITGADLATNIAISTTGAIATTGNLSGNAVAASGNLTVGGNATVTGDISATNVTASGNVVAANVSSTITATRELQLIDPDDPLVTAKRVKMVAPLAIAADYTLTWPLDDGTANQVLSTDGAGILSWTSFPSTASMIVQDGNTFAAPMTIGTNDAQPLNLETGGTTKLTVLNNGNVGVGTATPGVKFEIGSGNALLANAGKIQFKDNGGTAKDILDVSSNGINNTVLSSINNLYLRVNETTVGASLISGGGATYTFNTGSLTALSGGNVGIGTTTPNRILEVAGPIRITPTALPGSAAAGDIAIDSGAANALKWYNGTAWQTIGSGSGDALTTNPLSQFAATTSAQLAGVLSDETGTGLSVFNTNPTFATNINAPMITGGTGTTSTLTYKTTTGVGAAGADHIFQVGNNGSTEAMRIQNNGYVGIGTATPGSPLEVSYSSNSVSGGLHVRNTLAGSNALAKLWTTNETGVDGYFGTTSSAYSATTAMPASSTFMYTTGAAGISLVSGNAAGTLRMYTGGAASANERLRIDAAGNVGIGTTSPNRLLEVAGPIRISPTALPGSAAAGDIAIDSAAANALKWYSGTAWQTIGSGSGDALTTNPLSQFAATTSAQLAGVLSDETGTGLAVFGTAPTFTTNITSPMVVGGTGTTSTLTYKTTTGVGAAGADHIFQVGNNGATEAMRILNNGNVGIGTASPLAPVHVEGAASFAWVNSAKFNAGGTGAGNAGSYVAIQASTSSGRFDGGRIYGGRWTTGSPVARGIRVAATDWAGAQAVGAEFNFLQLDPDNNAFYINTNNAERFRIDSSGKVGIGTVTPNRLLEVAGPIRISPSALPGSAAAGDIAIDSAAANALKWYNGTAWQTIGSGSGDALTTNPLSQFAATTSAQLAGVLSDETGTGLAVFATSPTFTTNITSPMVVGGTATTSTLTYKTTTGIGAAGADHVFQVGNNGATEAMRILNNGNIGIGTAAPGAALDVAAGNIIINNSQKLYLNHSGAAPDTNWSIGREQGATGAQIISNGTVFHANNNSAEGFMFRNSANTSLMEIVGDGSKVYIRGSVGIGTTSPNRKLEVAGPIRISPSALPGSAAAGDIAIDSGAANALKWYNGSAWQTIGSGNGDALTTNPLSQFAATTSAQLAGVLSDETGTGLSVFATAPTFTTNITSPMIIGGTGTTSTLIHKTTTGVGAAGADQIFQVGNNGATEAMRILNNGRVGIGTATPGAALDIGTGELLVGNGTAGAPSLSFGSNPNTGIYRSGANSIGFSANGALVASIGSSGIWMATGDAPVIHPGAMGSCAAPNFSFATSTGAGFGAASTNTLSLCGGGNEGMRIDTSGGVVVGSGDGANFPGSGVLRGPNASTTQTDRAGGNVVIQGGLATGAAATGSITFKGAPPIASGTTQQTAATYMTIVGGGATAGNVGIGTTSPLALLHVNGSALFGANTGISTATPLNVSFGGTYGTNTPGSAGNLKWTMYNDGTAANSYGIGMSSGLMELRSGATADIGLFTNNGTPVMRLTTGGNVGIGTTSPNRKLEVAGPIRISPSALPGSAAAGDIAIDSGAANALKWYNGTAWQTIGSGSGDALTTNPLSQFAATTSAQLAGVLSDETGTGLAVFGTAPTFTTNITSPMVVGGTGTTSTLTYKTTTGVGAAGADHIFQVGNNGATEAMRILNDGKVGIGTAAPTHALTLPTASTGIAIHNVADQVTNTEVGALRWLANVLTLDTTNTGTGTARGLAVNSAAGVSINGATTANLSRAGGGVQGQFYLNGTGQLFAYAANGQTLNLGNNNATLWLIPGGGSSFQSINTNGGMLNGGAATATNPMFVPDKTNATTGFGSGASNALSFITSGTEKARLTNSGDFGIGTTSPNRLLEVAGPIRISPTALPGSAAAGDLAIDSGAANALKYYNGTAWIALTGGGSGDALVANPLSQFASTTSVQLSGVLSDETGSGAAVFGTSPDLITPVIGTGGFYVKNPAGTFNYKIVGSAITAARTLTIPVLTGSDTLVTTDTDQQFNGVKTFIPNKLRLLGGGSVNTYINSTPANGAPVTINLPNATGTVALLTNPQTWSGNQTFTNSNLLLLGSSTGATTFTSANAGASNYTLTVPAVTDTLATLGAAQTFSGADTFSSTASFTAAGNGISVTNGATFGGNVGIGTGSPNRLLEVSGPIRISPAALPIGAAGDIAIDSGAANALKYYNGTAWVSLTGGGTGDALVANPLSQFAATTSAQLAGVLSDETGTGVAVFGTTPTFTTNITSPMIVGGTATTSTLTYKTTTGAGAAGADHIFQVGNNGATEAMRILNNGRVGIGTNSPQVEFQVTASAPRIGLFDSDQAVSASNPTWQMRSYDVDGHFAIGNSSLANFGSAVDRLSIAANGNVGIGTTPASSLLSVAKSEPSTSGSEIDLVSNVLTVTNASTATGIRTASISQVDIPSSVNTAVATVAGVKGVATNANSGAPAIHVDDVIGGNFGATNSGSATVSNKLAAVDGYTTTSVGPVTNMYGANFWMNVLGASTVTNQYGLKVDSSSSGTITNRYMVYMVAPTGTAPTTLDYGIYQEGATQKNYFAGNVGIGATNPGRLLHVGGPIRIAPAALPTGAAGDIAIDSGAANALKYYNGTAWVSLTGGGTGDALVANPLSQFAATTSAQLAGVLSDETGTGLAAFGTSPTFTTDITTPKIIGGTGTTSTLIYQTTTGVGAAGADHIFKVGNNGATEAMRIQNNGAVGIGTASPAANLDLFATSISTTVTNNVGMRIVNGNNTVDNYSNIDFSAYDSTSTARTGAIIGAQYRNHGNNQTTADLYFVTTTTGTKAEKMRITGGGNVGIGTGSPVSKLSVNGDIDLENSTSVVRYMASLGPTAEGGNNTWASGTSKLIRPWWDVGDGNDKVSLYTPGSNRASEVMTLASSGYVGIGTTTPGSKLDVKGALRLSGSTSGYNGFQAAATAGSFVWTLPTADGTISQVLKTDGSGGLGWANANGSPTVSPKSSDFTVLTTEDNYMFAISGVTTATLPALAGVANGFRITLKRTGASNVTIQASGAETIDGANTRFLSSNYAVVELMKTPTEWLIIGGGATGTGSGCTPGSQSYSAGTTYSLTVSAGQAAACTYTVTVKGAGGGVGPSYGGGAGGGVSFTFTAPAAGAFDILVGSKGLAHNATAVGGYGGGGKGGVAVNGGGGGGGASVVKYDTTLLGIAGGGGGGGNSAVGGAGGSGGATGTVGGGTNPGGGGANNVGGAASSGAMVNGGAGGSSSGAGTAGGGNASSGGAAFATYSISGGGGGAISGSNGSPGGGGGYGGGGGGGAGTGYGYGGGGGGGYINSGNVNSFNSIAGAPSATDGSVTIDWN